MNSGDIAIGMRLVVQAQWNQLLSDWERFLAMQPNGCFVAEEAGAAVATTVTCMFDGVAWIAMVLVDEPRRGQGIGAALVQHALSFLDTQCVRSRRLDATRLGQPIYEKFGFKTQYSLTRFAGRVSRPHHVERTCEATPAQPADYPRLLAFDREITSTDRGKFLSSLFAENSPNVLMVARDERVLGWMTVRPGREAWQLGPCHADTQAGEALLETVVQRLSGACVFFDVPTANLNAVRWAEKAGLTAQRHFVRMCRGEPVIDDVLRLWGSSGPELG